MRLIIIIIVLLSSCKVYQNLPLTTQGTIDNPIHIDCCSELRVQSIQCIGDHITGGDSGGIYEVGSPPNSTLSIDSQGCFESDDMDCGVNEMWYIVNNDCDPPCYDTTSVFYLKCCVEAEINCSE